MEDVLGYYLTGATKNGVKVTLRSLPTDVRPIAKEARVTIDELSKMLLESKYISPDLKEEIVENLGKYLRKTYQFYEDKDYKPSKDVITDAKAVVAQMLQKARGTKKITC